MPAGNKIQYIILGLLIDYPLNGYTLKKMMDDSTSNFLKPSYGNIYPTLKALSDEGLIEPLEMNETKRHSTTYQVTATGHEVFRSWLLKPVDDLQFGHNHLLHMFFFRHLDETERALKIDQLIGFYQGEINRLKTLKTHIGPIADDFQIETLHYGIEVYELNIRFYQSLRTSKEAMNND